MFAPRTISLAIAVLAAASCAESPPSLEPVGVDRWEKALARERGRTVAVHVWAGWCRTCVEFFPSFVGLYKKYEPAGVAFLSVCLDDPADAAALADARALLVEQQAAFPHYVLQADLAESLWKLDVEGVPTVLVYGPDGERRYQLEGDPADNEISVADVEDAIESLLAESE